MALQSPGELIPRYDTRGRQAVRIKGFSPGYDDKFIRGDKTHRYFAGDSDDEDLIGCSGRIFF